jgi:hypothetical protein
VEDQWGCRLGGMSCIERFKEAVFIRYFDQHCYTYIQNESVAMAYPLQDISQLES